MNKANFQATFKSRSKRLAEFKSASEKVSWHLTNCKSVEIKTKINAVNSVEGRFGVKKRKNLVVQI